MRTSQTLTLSRYLYIVFWVSQNNTIHKYDQNIRTCECWQTGLIPSHFATMNMFSKWLLGDRPVLHLMVLKHVGCRLYNLTIIILHQDFRTEFFSSLLCSCNVINRSVHKYFTNDLWIHNSQNPTLSDKGYTMGHGAHFHIEWQLTKRFIRGKF